MYQWQHGKSLAEIKREIVLDCLEKHGGNRTETARALQVSRRTLRNWMSEWRNEGFAIIMPTRGPKPDRFYPPIDTSKRAPDMPDFGAELAKRLTEVGRKDEDPKVPEVDARTGPVTILLTRPLGRSVEGSCQAGQQSSQTADKPFSEISLQDGQMTVASSWEADEIQIPSPEPEPR